MLLTGLPGMGKSTALEQAAARWAADDDAPVPVLVPLRDLTRRHLAKARTSRRVSSFSSVACMSLRMSASRAAAAGVKVCAERMWARAWRLIPWRNDQHRSRGKAFMYGVGELSSLINVQTTFENHLYTVTK